MLMNLLLRFTVLIACVGLLNACDSTHEPVVDPAAEIAFVDSVYAPGMSADSLVEILRSRGYTVSNEKAGEFIGDVHLDAAQQLVLSQSPLSSRFVALQQRGAKSAGFALERVMIEIYVDSSGRAIEISRRRVMDKR